MTRTDPSTLEMTMTWLVVALTIALLALGAAWYGVSLDVHRRFWSDIADRLQGPMTLRLYMQPAMAAVAAIGDGIADARLGHKSFFWTARRDPTAQAGRLREGITSIARVLLIGISMDTVYQLRFLDQFYPVEALMMVILFAVLPYFILRWITEWIAGRWLRGSAGS